MLGTLDRLQNWIVPAAIDSPLESRLPAGLYHFHRERAGEHIRYHLRVDEDGPAILIAAASEAILLSPQGATIAKAMLEGQTATVLKRKNPDAGYAEQVSEVALALDDLGESNVRYPIFNLVDPATLGVPWRLSAPFQADLDVRSTDVAKEIVARLWDSRIPHVRFIVTPRTDRVGLVDLVVFAEDLGMIAGVRAMSQRWCHADNIGALADAGLDYMVFSLVIDEARHDAIFGRGDFRMTAQVAAMIRTREMTPVATLPLLPAWQSHLPEALDQLQDQGIHHVEVYALANPQAHVPGLPVRHDSSSPDEQTGRTESPSATERVFAPHELRQLAGFVEDLADSRRMQVVWLPPHAVTQSPALDLLVRAGPRAGGDVSIRVDGDGNVMPPRGHARVAGNVLVDSWSEIWQDAAFRRYRGRTQANTRCPQCPGMAICAADCPAEIASWVLP